MSCAVLSANFFCLASARSSAMQGPKRPPGCKTFPAPASSGRWKHGVQPPEQKAACFCR